MLKINVSVLLLTVLIVHTGGAQQTYTGPAPPAKDLPYLVHADNLLATEGLTATCHVEKKEVATCMVTGDKSVSRTPLASPAFVIESDKIDPEKLQLYRFDVKNGHREVVIHISGKGGAKPFNTQITKLSGSLYQIEVKDSLPPGEYSLSPSDGVAAFCFEVF